MDTRDHPVVDFEVVRHNTLEDAEFERRLLEAFLEDNHERVQRAKAALEAAAFEELHLEAHSLKGAASTLGAMPLARAAEAVESAAAEQRAKDAPALFAAMERELDRVCEALRERLAASAAS